MREFRASQLEAATAPCATVAEVERELAAARRSAAAALDGRALLIAAGAHPTAAEPGPVTPLERYLRLAEANPWATRHALTCGVHIHVAVSGADRAVAVHDALRTYLPELVALGANAPSSTRSALWPRHRAAEAEYRLAALRRSPGIRHLERLGAAQAVGPSRWRVSRREPRVVGSAAARRARHD